MYQYSLSYFTSLFNQCIAAAAPSDDLPTRLSSLLTYITEFMYKMVRRVLHLAPALPLYCPCPALAHVYQSSCARWYHHRHHHGSHTHARTPLPAHAAGVPRPV